MLDCDLLWSVGDYFEFPMLTTSLGRCNTNNTRTLFFNGISQQTQMKSSCTMSIMRILWFSNFVQGFLAIKIAKHSFRVAFNVSTYFGNKSHMHKICYSDNKKHTHISFKAHEMFAPFENLILSSFMECGLTHGVFFLFCFVRCI